MAAEQAYLIDPDGKVGAFAHEDALGLLGAGYAPAGKEQIEDFKREQAFHEKYGTLGQQVATAGEGAAQSLTFGLSDFLERGLGVPKEDILARQEENPGAHTAGVIAGVAAPLILTAGASAPEAGAALAGEGAEGAGLLSGAAEFTAPKLISRAGEAASEGVANLLGTQSTAVGRIAAKAAASGVGSSIEGAAYGAGQVVHESALGDPHLTASSAIEEIGLSALLGGGIGAGTGALGQLVGEAAGGAPGKKLEEWLHRFEGNRNLSAASGGAGVQSLLRKEAQKIGLEGVNQLGREGGEMGLVSAFSTPGETLARSEEAMESAGRKMGDILQGADAAPESAAPSAARVMSRARNEVLKPLAENPLNAGEARSVADILDSYENKFGAGNPENKLGFKALHDLRTEISKKIYGVNGNQLVSNEFKEALHDFRGIVSDEINKGLEATPGLDSAAWKAANREYQVASTFAKFAEKGLTAARGNNILPLTTVMSTLAGHVAGGPLGGAALGALSYGAKRFGSGILGSAARGVRELIDKGAAEGLASKTAEAVAEAREAGVGASAATRTQVVWNALSEKLGEPVAGPGKDLLRHVTQENIQGEGTPVETVAALSQLERANRRVQNRMEDGVSKLVRGAAKAGRAEVMAGVGSAFANGAESSQVAYQKRAEKLRHLAANPQLMQERIASAQADLLPHAPDTAQALAIAMSRCVSVLNGHLPPPAQHAPLEKPEPPTPDQVASFNRCYEVVNNPNAVLKQAAAGTLTPEAVAAVQAAHPQQFAAMQQALLQKLSTHKAPIPYAQRQMVSLLMGRDMDGTQTPAMIQANQAVFSVQHPAMPGPGSKPASKGLGHLKLSERLLTPAQASARRR